MSKLRDAPLVLTVASFNVLNLFEAGHDAKIRHLAEHIVAAQPHVLGLQEIGSVEAFERLRWVLRGRGLAYDHAIVAPPDERGIRNALLSSLPLSSSRIHAGERLPFPTFVKGDGAPFGERLRLRRAVPEARIVTPSGGTVCVNVVHWKSKRLELERDVAGAPIAAATARDFAESEVRSLVVRIAEALFVRGLVDEALARGDLPCVLGDFNDTLGSTPLRLVVGRPSAEGEDPSLYSALAGIPEARRFSVLNRGEPSLIDHVLVSRALAQHLVAAGIRNDALRDHGLPNLQPGTPEDSDHALVWATIDV